MKNTRYLRRMAGLVLAGVALVATLAGCASKGDTKTAQDIEEEFFWLIGAAVANLSQLGFLVKTRRFSDLSHGIVAEKVI